LPDYRFDPATGRWRHHLGPMEPPLRLRQVTYAADGSMQYPHHPDRAPESDLDHYLQQALALFTEPSAAADLLDDQHLLTPSADFEHLRWFDLPAVCLSPIDQ